MSDNHKLLEEYELIIHEFIKEALRRNYEDFNTSINSLSFEELLQFVSRESTGRSENYMYTIKDVVRAYLNNCMNNIHEKELKLRIASSSVFNIAMERYVFSSIINFLNKNISIKPAYSLNASPNSSDFSIIIENEVIQDIADLLNLEVDMEYLSNQYHGVLIHADAKSIMALSNCGDALINGSVVGKCQASWNQITYIPPRLNNAFENNDYYMRKKHSVLESTVYKGSKKYYTTSSFVVDFVYLDSNTNYFEIPINNIDSGSFNHIMYTITFPNGIHKNDYYDMFFNAGKTGYDEAENGVKYPKDCRIVIKPDYEYLKQHKGLSKDKILHELQGDDYLKFKGLEEEGKETIYRFDYINISENKGEKQYEIIYLNNSNELKTKTIIIPNIQTVEVIK